MLFENKDNINIILGHTVAEILGESTFEGIVIKDEETADTQNLALDGMFVAIGLVPQNENFENVISLDKFGYADYSEVCASEKNGIFVAGDCRKKAVRQVATAVSDGAIAAISACNYIDSLD